MSLLRVRFDLLLNGIFKLSDPYSEVHASVCRGKDGDIQLSALEIFPPFAVLLVFRIVVIRGDPIAFS